MLQFGTAKTHLPLAPWSSPPFAILFRIHLKVLTTLNPYIRKQSQQGHTVLIDTNLFSSQVAIPIMIPWEEITFPKQ